MKKPFIAGNWKMHNTISGSVSLANEIRRGAGDYEDVEIVVCPVFTALASVADVLSGSNIALGAQNLFWEEKGAFTGEVSAPMLKDAGCKYVIVGHSERRKYFGETDEGVNKKIKAALRFGLLPIMCVGETLEQRNSGKALEVVSAQIKGGLSGIIGEDMAKIVVAYEPVWAIGTGVNATPQQAEEVHRYIREILEGLFTTGISREAVILYGGSVKPNNIASLIQEKDIDGALVGGASLKADAFLEIVKKAAESV